MASRNIPFDDIIMGFIEKKEEDKRTKQELEIRFGTMRDSPPITRTNYDNVVKRIISSGFKLKRTEYMLRVIPEFKDKGGTIRLSNVRAEINGMPDIKEYCNTDTYTKINHTLTQKLQTKGAKGQAYSIDNPDYNFRMSLAGETAISKGERFYNSVTESWNYVKKIFRYIQRYTFVCEDMPFIQIDLSMVKESTRKGGNMVHTTTIKESNVFNNPVKYEIELEFINDAIGRGTTFNSLPTIIPIVRKCINLILSGIQGTNYPISIYEQRYVADKYKHLIGSRNKSHLSTSEFIGPSSMTLQMINIAEQSGNSVAPNIRSDYTVTDKADGTRKLLYVSNEGKIYLIDMNMNVQFTGSETKNSSYYETILDGEHITNDKDGTFINMYASFDVYFVKGNNVRGRPFVSMDDTTGRHEILKDVRSKMNMEPINKKLKAPPLNVTIKEFLVGTPDFNIFRCCNEILDKEKRKGFTYNIDGLIFTPCYMGVGGDSPGNQGELRKRSWVHSFKWKPPEFNTIDFMVSTLKDTKGTSDKIDSVFEVGKMNRTTDTITQYKTLLLHVGFDEGNREHGYLDPCKYVRDGMFERGDSGRTKSEYKAVRFYPTEPYDEDAGICKIELSSVGDNIEDAIMLTDEGDVVEDKQIVEFAYNHELEKGWRWKPLRVRYDKTAELQAGGRNFGNAYHVANSNWHSIHNPITAEMLTTGANIPSETSDDSIYYNRTGNKSNTLALREFHNLFVKSRLIGAVSKPGDKLIDMAVGKAGDWSKWIHSDLRFILGLDISRDNIENRIDGACARTLNYHKRTRHMPDAIFLNGDSSKNIKNGAALYKESDRTTIKALFGMLPDNKKSEIDGAWIKKHVGICGEGFEVSSIQFAIHYMFENKGKVLEFIRNVSETTKVDGYFIGTCYDGKSVFDTLKRKKPGESHIITNNDVRIGEITRRYESDEFKDDDSSIGYAIDVYQESINKVFREYLVNFTYLDIILGHFGFTKLSSDELSERGLQSSTGSFRDLYSLMMDEYKGDIDRSVRHRISEMSPGEKEISFMNRYFIYKKVRNVDLNEVVRVLGSNEDLPEPVQSEPEPLAKSEPPVQSEPESPDPLAKSEPESVPVPKSLDKSKSSVAQSKSESPKSKSVSKSTPGSLDPAPSKSASAPQQSPSPGRSQRSVTPGQIKKTRKKLIIK